MLPFSSHVPVRAAPLDWLELRWSAPARPWPGRLHSAWAVHSAPGRAAERAHLRALHFPLAERVL